jgi:hypothetical protein
MPAAQPSLEPGRVYRTRELATWSANAPRLARRLVDEGADVNFASENGVTPLMRAAAAGLDAVVARLVGLPGGVTKLDRVNMMGNSALILACWNGHVNSALSLVDAGASLDLVNKDDKTALDYAVRSEVPEVVAAIRARGGHARSELKARAAAAAAGGGKAAAAASASATPQNATPNAGQTPAPAQPPVDPRTALVNAGINPAPETGVTLDALVSADPVVREQSLMRLPPRERLKAIDVLLASGIK